METVCEEKKVVTAYILKIGCIPLEGSKKLGSSCFGKCFDVFAVEGDREDELALRDDINAVELVEDGARCDLLEYEVEQIPHSAEDDLPENNNPAKQDAILGRS